MFSLRNKKNIFELSLIIPLIRSSVMLMKVSAVRLGDKKIASSGPLTHDSTLCSTKPISHYSLDKLM